MSEYPRRRSSSSSGRSSTIFDGEYGSNSPSKFSRTSFESDEPVLTKRDERPVETSELKQDNMKKFAVRTTEYPSESSAMTKDRNGRPLLVRKWNSSPSNVLMPYTLQRDALYSRCGDPDLRRSEEYPWESIMSLQLAYDRMQRRCKELQAAEFERQKLELLCSGQDHLLQELRGMLTQSTDQNRTLRAQRCLNGTSTELVEAVFQMLLDIHDTLEGRKNSLMHNEHAEDWSSRILLKTTVDESMVQRATVIGFVEEEYLGPLLDGMISSRSAQICTLLFQIMVMLYIQTVATLVYLPTRLTRPHRSERPSRTRPLILTRHSQ